MTSKRTKRTKSRRVKSRPKRRAATRSRRRTPKADWWQEYFPWAVSGSLAAVLTVALFNTATQKGQYLNGRGTQREISSLKNYKAVSILDQKIYDLSQAPMSERVQYWSEEILNEYKKSKFHIMEELWSLKSDYEIRDTVPLVSKKLDCTTYVELVIALSKSRNLMEFSKNLLNVRYSDQKQFDYFHRNHFPEADWVPNNVSTGTLADITKDVASRSGVEAVKISKVINRGVWFQAQIDRGRLTRGIASSLEVEMDPLWAEPVEASVRYIPLSQLDLIKTYIPDGALLNVVRKSESKNPVLISHQGFVIKKNDQLYFRHASKGGKIKTVPLDDYFKHFSVLADQAGWPVLGFNLLSVR